MSYSHSTLCLAWRLSLALCNQERMMEASDQVKDFGTWTGWQGRSILTRWYLFVKGAVWWWKTKGYLGTKDIKKQHLLELKWSFSQQFDTICLLLGLMRPVTRKTHFQMFGVMNESQLKWCAFSGIFSSMSSASKSMSKGSSKNLAIRRQERESWQKCVHCSASQKTTFQELRHFVNDPGVISIGYNSVCQCIYVYVFICTYIIAGLFWDWSEAPSNSSTATSSCSCIYNGSKTLGR